MKGERTIDDKPFRYGGIERDYDSTSEEWAEHIPEMRRCYICGGKMQNVYSPQGTLLKRTYPYIGLFHITKGKHKGRCKFRIMCRACAYDLGRGVIEMDGHTYKDKNEFHENKFKDDLKRGICWNCKHLKKHNGELAEFVCDIKGSVVTDTMIRGAVADALEALPSADRPRDEEDQLKFYYVESIDDYWIGMRIDNFYYADWHEGLGFVWSKSRYLPWGEHIVDENTLWKEHTYPSEPIEIPFTEWIVGFVKKYFTDRPRGEWLETAQDYYETVNKKGGGVNENTEYFTDDIACPNCLAKFSNIDNETERFNFCPNCGADMRGEDEAIKSVPSTGRLRGYWIGDKCSVCGEERAWYGSNPPICPDCGADMRSE